jgi:UrcA family protein
MLIRQKLRLVAAFASGVTASVFLAVQPASAQGADVNVYGEPVRANTVRVRFADLNLRTAHDQIRLYHRVGGAIERVCDIDLGRDGLQDRGYYACTYRAWGVASPQIARARQWAMAGRSWMGAAIVISGR